MLVTSAYLNTIRGLLLVYWCYGYSTSNPVGPLCNSAGWRLPTSVRPSPPIDGLKGAWSVSRSGLERRRFLGDPTSLARDNIYLHFRNEEFHSRNLPTITTDVSSPTGTYSSINTIFEGVKGGCWSHLKYD